MGSVWEVDGMLLFGTLGDAGSAAKFVISLLVSCDVGN